MKKSHNSVKLYVDGACQPNPGRGGWAFVAGVPPTLSVTFVSFVFVNAAGVITGIPNDATVLVLTTPPFETRISVALAAVGMLCTVKVLDT